MHIVLGISLILHGVIHVIGFLVYWKITDLEEMPYQTTQLGGLIDVGDTGIRLIGICWLLAMLALVGAGIGTIAGQAWWPALTLWASVFSLLLTVLGWPDSKIGVVVNIIVIGYLLFGFGRG